MSVARTDIEFEAIALAAKDDVAKDQKGDFSTLDGEGNVISEKDSENAKHHPDVDPDGNVWVHPTEDERSGPNALRRVRDRMPLIVFSVGLIEMAERFSYYGCTAVFTNFIQYPLPPGSTTGSSGAVGTAGALGRGQNASFGLVTFFNFWVYVTPLFGAYVADAHLGRFKTICWAVLITLVGHVLLIVAAIPSVIKHPNGAMAAFAVAIVIMGIGSGSFKSNISPLIAEQYKVTAMRVKTLPSGERVIVDPTITYARIFSWFYWLINVGSIIGSVGMTYSEKYVGFWLAYTLPTIVFLMCPMVLLWGRTRYQRTPPSGSVLANAVHILATCTKGTWSLNPLTTFRRWKQPGFWDKAKPSVYASTHNGQTLRWMTFSDEYVDQVARGFKACQVFIFFPLYWICYNQINNNLTSQASFMTTNGVPNDLINNLNPLSLVIFIPITIEFIYPAMERKGIRFTPVKRIFWGFMLGVTAMIWAAIVQLYIYRTSPCGYSAATCTTPDGNTNPSPLNVWIQTGSYVLIGFSEICASITGLEYAFTKAPKNMRSLVTGVFLLTSAIGSAINEAMNPLVSDPLQVWNYGAAAIIAFVAGIAFWICFGHLDKEEDALNEIGAYNEEAKGAPETEKPHHV